MDKGSNKQKLVVQIVCILISIGLWIYVTNIENPIRAYSLTKVPVNLKNLDALKESGLAVYPNEEYYVTLQLEGQSQEYLNMQRSDFKLEVDLSEYVLNVGKRKIPVRVVDSPNNISIKNSVSLAIELKIEELITKEIPIKSQIDVIAKSSYYVATPIFSPKAISISGPASIVNKVEHVVAQGQEENVEKTIVKNYIITPVDKNYEEVENIELSQEWVEATININEGRDVNVIVNTKGKLPEDMKLLSINPTINSIEIVGPQEVLNNISQVYTEEIDLSKIKETTVVETKIIIPDGVNSNSGNTVNVKINIDKVMTKEFTIKAEFIGIDETKVLTPINDNVKVIVKGFEDELKLLKEENLKVILDVAEIVELGKYNKIPIVTIENVEGNFIIDSISEVEFEIVEDKESVTTDTFISGEDNEQ